MTATQVPMAELRFQELAAEFRQDIEKAVTNPSWLYFFPVQAASWNREEDGPEAA